MTEAEEKLWSYLKKRKLDGRKFRRQFSVDRYILDFYCPDEKLNIELDGAHHFNEEGKVYDQDRDEFLDAHGIKVLRFENNMVFEKIEEVLKKIKDCFTPPVKTEFQKNTPL